MTKPQRGYLWRTMKATEKRVIAQVLRRHEGNVTHAARALGICRKSLQLKMREHALRES